MILDLLEDEEGVAVDQDDRRYVRRPDGRWRWEDSEPDDAPPILLGLSTYFLVPGGGPLRWAPPSVESRVELVAWRDRVDVIIDGRRWQGPVRLLVDEPFGRRYVEVAT